MLYRCAVYCVVLCFVDFVVLYCALLYQCVVLRCVVLCWANVVMCRLELCSEVLYCVEL